MLLPIGHSSHFDRVRRQGELWRVQVKTSVSSIERSAGGKSYTVQLATRGGNQSWTGVSKRLDPTNVDYVFVVVCDGRRWIIPTRSLETRTTLRLGGSKYAEYEISRGIALESLVYGADYHPSTIADPARGSAVVGETGWTVNPVAMPEWVRIPPPPSPLPEPNENGAPEGAVAQTTNRRD